MYREFLQHIDCKKVQRTNPKCIIKTDIVEQEEPSITVHLGINLI